jgi:hypothetical protein
MRRPFALIALLIAAVGSGACAQESPFAPTPIIVPDAVSVPSGTTQVFVVQNAAVSGFSLVMDGRNWAECVQVDTSNTVSNSNSLRLILRPSCTGLVYVSAQIGAGRSPLVAVMAIN